MESATLTRTGGGAGWAGRLRAPPAAGWAAAGPGVLAIAALLAFVVSPPLPHYDSYYSMLWGRPAGPGVAGLPAAVCRLPAAPRGGVPHRRLLRVVRGAGAVAAAHRLRRAGGGRAAGRGAARLAGDGRPAVLAAPHGRHRRGA